jgi:mono/diheme cytochrome c family protein
MSEAGKARTWVLAWLAFSVAGLGLFVGVGCGTKANACPFRKSKPFTSTDGRTIFAVTCASCHGVDARGGRGPNLLTTTYDQKTLAGKIFNGKPLAGMPAFGKASFGGIRLTQEQIDAVAAYLITLRSSS